MNKPFAWFIKLTGMPIQHFYYKKKVYCEGGDKKLKKFKGPALIICNHTSVYDFPLILYTFISKDIRTLIGEGAYSHSKTLNVILNTLGGIKVERQEHDFSFISKMSNILKKGKIGLIFPESRLHTDKDPKGLLPFAPSYVYIALKNNVPIIPIYTNGVYGKKKKQSKDCTRLIIGKKIFVNNLYDQSKSEKENIQIINDYCKNYIIKLGQELERIK